MNKVNSMIDRITKSMGLPKKQSPFKYVKSILAIKYYTDGNLFIERYDILSSNIDSMNNRDFRAKAMVDLCMSIECSLKSLIISLSKDDIKPVEIKKKVIKKSHHIDKLVVMAKSFAKNRFALPDFPQNMLNDIVKLGVGYRYSLDVWDLYTKERQVKHDSLINSNIDNYVWMHDLRKLAVNWNNSADNAHKRFLKKHHIVVGGGNGKKIDAAMDEYINSK
ncbi:MAG: hypothetical protein KH812_19395 [Proteus hauseri]|nr:hypothetical protein [Proteus hauseri]